MPCGSFTVESESIGMGNVCIVHKVFLNRPIVKIQEAQLILTNPCDAFTSEMDQIGLFKVEYGIPGPI